MLRNRHAYRALGWVLATAALALGCRQASGAAADASPEAKREGSRLVLPPGSPQIASLQTAVATEDRSSAIVLNGRLVWNEDATVRVFSPFAGRVDTILAGVGERVRARDRLALIASPDFGQAQADARRASADLDLAQRSLARQRDLLDHGIVARKDVESAEADVTRARVEQQRAGARVGAYGGDTTVDQVFPLRTALGGIIVERNLTPGQEVRPDQMLANAPQLFAPLFVVTDPSRLWLLLDVPESDLQYLHTGSAVTIRARTWPPGSYHGVLTLVSGEVDPVTHTVKARGVVDNPDNKLRAELLVNVELARGKTASVAVPTGAVLLNGNAHTVFVEEAPGRYARRDVHIGAEHDGVIPILDGVRAGEKVVIGSALLLEQLFQTTSGS
jgi:cobalt-zinc-cadmium efflux system membrane fusion protein